MLLSKEGRATIRAEDVAEALGETIASVKSRLHRARMALGEMLTVTYMAAPC